VRNNIPAHGVFGAEERTVRQVARDGHERVEEGGTKRPHEAIGGAEHPAVDQQRPEIDRGRSQRNGQSRITQPMEECADLMSLMLPGMHQMQDQTNSERQVYTKSKDPQTPRSRAARGAISTRTRRNVCHAFQPLY
jgi:hypothetical protein